MTGTARFIPTCDEFHNNNNDEGGGGKVIVDYFIDLFFFLCSRHFAKYLTCIILFNIHSNTIR